MTEDWQKVLDLQKAGDVVGGTIKALNRSVQCCRNHLAPSCSVTARWAASRTKLRATACCRTNNIDDLGRSDASTYARSAPDDARRGLAVRLDCPSARQRQFKLCACVGDPGVALWWS